MINPFGHFRLLISTIWILQAFTSTAETIAYYRFENGAPGELMGNSASRSIVDSSGNGYHFNPFQNSVCSADVPETDIPRTREKKPAHLSLPAPNIATDLPAKIWDVSSSLTSPWRPG